MRLLFTLSQSVRLSVRNCLVVGCSLCVAKTTTTSLAASAASDQHTVIVRSADLNSGPVAIVFSSLKVYRQQLRRGGRRRGRGGGHTRREVAVLQAGSPSLLLQSWAICNIEIEA